MKLQLETISSEKIKNCPPETLIDLCEDLRKTIYETVMHCGGHLASNLGAIESTVALFKVFDFPKDKIIFDVGHQCYAYKLLSGRYDRFSTLRKSGGISGFPKRQESVYDCYNTGHAGTSVSAAIGFAKARDLRGENHHVIAFIGDGSFNNGLVYEALCGLSVLNTNILIILNDNDMSISPTVGGMHDVLSNLKNTSNKDVRLLEQFGLQYIGVKDGNNVLEMVDALQTAKQSLQHGSVLLHIETTKGKGYEFSEEDPTSTHGIAPMGSAVGEEYSTVLGQTLCEIAKEDEQVTVVSAAMTEALGLADFFNQYPNRAFDVGICEENAAVLCASMAAGGLKPYYAIYSTFLQRAFDEIIHDVCGQNLPVTFCIDRAGISGADGETHQGVFDLSYLSLIPGLAIAAPRDTNEFREMLRWSVHYNAPLAIRYPRAGQIHFDEPITPIEVGKWEFLHRATEENQTLTILAAGERSLLLAMSVLNKLQQAGKECNVVNARFVKPLDLSLLENLSSRVIVTIEDNVELGGFGGLVGGALRKMHKDCTLKNFAYRDEFIVQGSVSKLQADYGVNYADIESYVFECLQ